MKIAPKLRMYHFSEHYEINTENDVIRIISFSHIYINGISPYQQLIRLLDKPRRNRSIKFIGNAHGLAAFVLHIAGSPQECKGGCQVILLFELSDK